MKVYEIIEISRWVEGSGFSNTETLSSGIVEANGSNEEELKARFDWKWWDKSESADGEDLKINVKYYRPDYDSMFDDEEPIAQFEIWESEIND